MTEYVEDDELYEDDDEGDPVAREQLAELHARIDEQQRLAAIQDEIVALERHHGSRFSYDDVQQIGALIDAGHDPADVYEHVNPQTPEQQDAEQDYEITVERFEREEGRALSEPEQDRVWDAVANDDEEVQLHDVDTRQGRRDYAAERIAETFEPQETPEQVEPLHPDADAGERRDYAQARLAGAEVNDSPYADYGIETGEPTE